MQETDEIKKPQQEIKQRFGDCDVVYHESWLGVGNTGWQADSWKTRMFM